jgi:MmyB-like transcription regulator ligand binding domain
MAVALLGDLSSIPPTQRNIARQAFTGTHRLEFYAEERERLNRALVSDLRRCAARYRADPELQRLVSDLRAASADFERLWTLRELNERHGDTKRIHHPELGVLELDCNVLEVHGDDQVLLVYSAAPGTPAAEALQLLRVIGLQDVGHTSTNYPRPPIQDQDITLGGR